MKKKLLSLTLAAAMCLGLLAGCGDPGSSESPSQSTQPSESSSPTPSESPSESTAPSESQPEGLTGTLKVSGWDMEVSGSLFRAVIDAFTAANPGVTIEAIDIPAADYGTKLSVMLNGGSEVDVFWVKDADTIYPIASRGQMTDMNSYIQRDGLDLGVYNGQAEDFNIDGKQIGMPFRTDYYTLFYNKDIFDACGVEYPSNDMTWAEFEELARKVTTGEGVDKKYGAYFHTWQACVENWGVQDGQHTIMDTDYSFFKPYYEMVLRMQEEGTCMDYGTVKTSNLTYTGVFSDGSVAMLPMGTWLAATMIEKVKSGESSVNWGIATLPHPDNVEAGYVVGATTPISINAASPNQDLAWEFVKFVCSAEGAAAVANLGGVPALLDDATLKALTSVDGYPEGALEALQVKNMVRDRPIADKVSEVNQMLGEVHSLIMLGEVSVDEGLADMAEQSKTIQGG